jgi:signal transduction histidine kinase
MQRLTLRDRLAVSFALALALAYAAIATCAIFVVHRSLRGAVDGQLTTVAQSISAIASDDRNDVDREDRQQFAAIAADVGGAIVLDSNGDVVMATTPDIPPWLPAAVADAKLGRIFTVHTDQRDVRAIVVRRRKHEVNNHIIVWQSMRIVHDVERPVLFVLGVFGLIVLVGGYAAGAQIAKQGLLPLTRITAVVAEIAAHDLSLRLGPQPHADELGLLAATFDRMLDRLAAAFERQRQFTADASHDLRAPLSTLRAEVDLALRAERTNAQYKRALEEIALDADHLDRLIDALLAAARSDAGDFTLRPLALDDLATAAVAQIEPMARAKNVTIVTTVTPQVQILGDPDLLARALLAALHNAVKYTPADRSIEVAVTAAAGQAHLRVDDDGPGFSDAARVHAFDRFWRDDTARGRDGSGLGLAIAHGIVKRCGGEIAIDNRPAGGGQVTMIFPLRTVLGRAAEPVEGKR